MRHPIDDIRKGNIHKNINLRKSNYFDTYFFLLLIVRIIKLTREVLGNRFKKFRISTRDYEYSIRKCVIKMRTLFRPLNTTGNLFVARQVSIL